MSRAAGKQSNKQVTASVKKGDIAITNDPSKCVFGEDLKARGFRAPKVTIEDTKFSVPATHPMVLSGELEAGRYTVPTPRKLVHFLGSFEGNTDPDVCQKAAAPRDLEIVFDLTDAVFEPFRNREVEKAQYRGPQGRDATDPKRKEDRRRAQYRKTVRDANARLRRMGEESLTTEKAMALYGHILRQPVTVA